jgi:hypothetical protein
MDPRRVYKRILKYKSDDHREVRRSPTDRPKLKM